jgi:hypothetical protein
VDRELEQFFLPSGFGKKAKNINLFTKKCWKEKLFDKRFEKFDWNLLTDLTENLFVDRFDRKPVC